MSAVEEAYTVMLQGSGAARTTGAGMAAQLHILGIVTPQHSVCVCSDVLSCHLLRPCMQVCASVCGRP